MAAAQALSRRHFQGSGEPSLYRPSVTCPMTGLWLPGLLKKG